MNGPSDDIRTIQEGEITITANGLEIRKPKQQLHPLEFEAGATVMIPGKNYGDDPSDYWYGHSVEKREEGDEVVYVYQVLTNEV